MWFQMQPIAAFDLKRTACTDLCMTSKYCESNSKTYRAVCCLSYTDQSAQRHFKSNTPMLPVQICYLSFWGPGHLRGHARDMKLVCKTVPCLKNPKAQLWTLSANPRYSRLSVSSHACSWTHMPQNVIKLIRYYI